MAGRGSGGGPHLGFSLVLLLLGFLVATGFVQERLREQDLPTRRAELEALVGERREEVGRLAAEVEALTRRLAEVRDRVSSESSEVREVVGRVEDLGPAAGTAPLTGPGVVVRLTDSGRAAATRGAQADLRIQDADLRAVVNFLWRAGAEAVAINDRRVVATTAIRAAGGVIQVNYAAVTSPYRVVAIGDPAALMRALERSEIARRFAVWRDVYGLGFAAEPADRLTVPPFSGLGPLRWARPAAGG